MSALTLATLHAKTQRRKDTKRQRFRDQGGEPQKAKMGAVLLYPPNLRSANASDVKRVIENLLAAKDRLTERRSAVRSARERVQELDRAAKEQEAEMKLEIAFETGANGKPRFSNEALREAELTRRKSRSPQYRAVESALSNARKELQEIEDELAAALDDFRSWQIIAKLKTAEMSALAD